MKHVWKEHFLQIVHRMLTYISICYMKAQADMGCLFFQTIFLYFLHFLANSICHVYVSMTY